MLGAVYYRIGDFTPRMSPVHFAQFKTGFQQSFDGRVDSLFGDKPFRYGFRYAFEIAATFEVGSAQYGIGGSVCGVGMRFMFFTLEEVSDSSAVGDNKTFEAPVVTENLGEQAVAAAAGFTLETVVGTHHFFYSRFLHEFLERGKIRFP